MSCHCTRDDCPDCSGSKWDDARIDRDIVSPGTASAFAGRMGPGTLLRLRTRGLRLRVVISIARPLRGSGIWILDPTDDTHMAWECEDLERYDVAHLEPIA